MSSKSTHSIEFEHLIRVDDGPQLDPVTRDLMLEASDFLLFYSWVDEIKATYVSEVFEGVMAQFLFHIDPKIVGVDDFVWVLVGDLPPAYITVEDSPNPKCALDSYIGAMGSWVSAVSEGRPIKGLIPVNAAATVSNAKSLSSKLRFLDEEILPLCKGEL